MTKKAEVGIGTLIIFISMILVAAIATGVLIQTSSQLQSKAIDTGRQTNTQVSTSIMPVQLYVLNTETNSSLDPVYNFTFLKIRLSPGSNSIRLTEALLNVDTLDNRESLRYNASFGCGNYTNLSTNGAGHFSANFISGGSDVNYINQGDVVELCFPSPEALTEAMPMRVSFVPKSGQSLTLDLQMPQVMTNFRVEIYP
ncbi:MAG: archaellin/type IV pilin N-terminal domain-containing protein [Candidatus Woesearchaeota archaeon]